MAKITYKHTAGPCSVSVLDASGAVHDDLVFDPTCSVAEDDQAYGPTIAALLRDGLIEVVEAKKSTSRKAT